MLSLFGLILGYLYIREINKQIDKSMEILARTVSQDCDAVLNQITEVYNEIIRGDEIGEYLDGDMPTMKEYSHLKSIIEKFTGPDYLETYIDGFSYVNLEHGWVLSNRGLYSFQELLNLGEMEEILKQELAENEWKKNFWLNGTDREKTENRNYVSISGISYVILRPAIGKTVRSMLIINIRVEELFLKQQLVDGLELLVLDSAGELVYESSDPQELFGDRNYRIVSERTGWTYIVFNRTSSFLTVVGGLGVIFLLFLLTGTLILLYVNRAQEKIYQPVSQLVDQTKQLNQDQVEVTNEFMYLQQKISTLFQSNRDMEQQLTEYIDQISDLFLRRLLAGELEDSTLELQMRQIGIRHRKFYAVIVVSPAEIREDTEPMMLLLANSIPGDILETMLLQPYWNGKEIIFLAGRDSEEQLTEEIRKFIERMGKYADAAIKCHLSAAVSEVYQNFSRTSFAYHECLEALKSSYGLVKESDDHENMNVIYFTDISLQKEKRIIYHANLEKRLEDAIGNGDLENSIVLLDEFQNWVEENGFRSYELSMAYYHLLTSILTAANNAGISINKVFGNGKNIYQDISQLYRRQEIREFFVNEVIKPIILYLNQERSSAADAVWKRIVALIEESEGNITLNECADRIGYHPGYIWRVMKSRTDLSFTDYLSSYKLDLARKLLRETDEPITQIATRLNYSSSQNFIRFFNKSEGMTPGKYRSMYRKK